MFSIVQAMPGHSKKIDNPDKSQQQRTATAYHEAGHAVMALLVGRPVEKVTITPAKLQTGGSRLGACKVQKGRTKASKDAIEDEVLILLAGMVAESQFTKRYCTDGASQDLMAVRRLLSNRGPRERQLEKLTQRMLHKTEHVLSQDVNARTIAVIANLLMEKDTISGRAVRQLHEEASAAE